MEKDSPNINSSEVLNKAVCTLLHQQKRDQMIFPRCRISVNFRFTSLFILHQERVLNCDIFFNIRWLYFSYS